MVFLWPFHGNSCAEVVILLNLTQTYSLQTQGFSGFLKTTLFVSQPFKKGQTNTVQEDKKAWS